MQLLLTVFWLFERDFKLLQPSQYLVLMSLYPKGLKQKTGATDTDVSSGMVGTEKLHADMEGLAIS